MPGVITGKHVLYDAALSINGVDLSDHVESVTFEVGINKQDAAAMGDINDYGMPGTQMVSPISVSFYQDYAAAKTYATLSAAFTNRTIFTLLAKASSGANSATNPQFSIPVFVGKMPLLTGKRGDRHMGNCTLEPAGLLTILTS